MPKSPYLNEPTRLPKVLSAIQVMGTYKFYKLDFAGWADRISGDAKQADHWKRVFEEHPEFFRLDAGRGKASLVWRRTYQKLYDVDKEEKITRERFHQLTVEEKTRISRNPLTNEDISTLITAAIQLHSRVSCSDVPLIVRCQPSAGEIHAPCGEPVSEDHRGMARRGVRLSATW